MKAKVPSTNTKQSPSSKSKATSNSNGKGGAGSLPPVNVKAGSPTKAPNSNSKAPSKGGDAGKAADKLPAISSVKADEAVGASGATAQSVNETAVVSGAETNETTSLPTNAAKDKENATDNLIVIEAVKGAQTPSSSAAASEETGTVPPPTAEPVPPAEPTYKPEEHNGNVTLIYEQYNEQFSIVNGSTSQENIDEVYCLSFVMPNCLIHLSIYPSAEWRIRDADRNYEGLYLEEKPKGVYQGLIKDATYYVYVEQEAEQLKRDQEIMKQRLKTEPNSHALKKDDGRVLESCSCIYGNPCVDEYGCKDWSNRFAVATKNGWKGF